MSSKKYTVNVDYLRAVKLLSTRLHTAMDLVKYWSICGPCTEECPEIEKIEKREI
jgi:hypothetical protein